MLMANENGPCGRSETLVAYLYGELPEADAQTFAGHAARCAQCSAELVEFGGLHRSMGEWRAATLGQMAQPSIEPAVWMPEAAPALVPARPSRWSTIAEFFTASPMWARASLALAALALIVLGLVYVFPGFRSNPASVAGGPEPKPEPVAPVQPAPQVTPPTAENRVAKTVPPVSVSSKPPRPMTPRLLAKGTERRQVSSTDREQSRELAQLTNDILLVSSSEDSVPTLSDLLTETETPRAEPNQ